MAKLTAWRLVKPKYALDAYNGEGARRLGGRWNPPGVAMAYASESRALAALEILVHVKKVRLLAGLKLVGVEFESAMVQELALADLPDSWSSDPSSNVGWMKGKAWSEAKSTPVLAVPSVVVFDERNYLFNPSHQDFAHCQVLAPEDFRFDPRLKDI